MVDEINGKQSLGSIFFSTDHDPAQQGNDDDEPAIHIDLTGTVPDKNETKLEQKEQKLPSLACDFPAKILDYARPRLSQCSWSLLPMYMDAECTDLRQRLYETMQIVLDFVDPELLGQQTDKNKSNIERVLPASALGCQELKSLRGLNYFQFLG